MSDFTPLQRQRRFLMLMCVSLIVSILATALLGACAATIPESPSTIPESPSMGCLTSVRQDDTTWCLVLEQDGDYRLVERRGQLGSRASHPLPIGGTISLRQVLTLGYGFDSIWIGYSAHPMSVLRVDATTLSVRANVPIDTGWHSRHFGSYGDLVVGAGAVWVLADQRLSRLDPESESVSSSISAPLSVSVAIDGDDLWLAMRNRIIQVHPETLETLASFTVPDGTVIATVLIADGQGLRVLLQDHRRRNDAGRGFWERVFPPAQPLIWGHLDQTTGTIVADLN